MEFSMAWKAFIFYLFYFFTNCVLCQYFSRIFFFYSLINYYCLFSFDLRAFRWVQTMVFAIDEINRNPRLLPGVKLGYRILDGCDHVHTSLQHAFSLVNGPSFLQTNGSVARSLPCFSTSPVPAIIGQASSTPTRAIADTFGPFEIPLVSLYLKD